MDINVPKPVNEVMLMLQDKDYEAYLVGGTVRNLVMGQVPNHYDISTDADITQIEKVYKSMQTYHKGEDKKILSINNAKFPINIRQYRSSIKTLEAELAECDFTMNALAFSDDDGLIDYSTGVVDIRNRIIRVNSDSDEVFIKDPLRILRAIRLSAEYAMKIDLTTQKYMFDNKELLAKVAKERVRDEISKILVTPRGDFYIKKYFDIIVQVIPELSLLQRFDLESEEHIYDGLEHSLVTVKNIEPNLELRLAMLFHCLGKPYTKHTNDTGEVYYKDSNIKSSLIARDILNRLKFNKKVIQKVTKLIEYHDYIIPEDRNKMKDFLGRFGVDLVEDLFKVKKADLYGKSPACVSQVNVIEEEYVRLKSVMRKSSYIKRNELRLTGRDLVDLGVTEDNVGNLLNQIYLEVLAGNVKNNHEKLEEYANSLVEENREYTLKKSA